MWSLSEGRFKKPHTPMFNWEELSKINPNLLRTMRHITFGKYHKSSDDTYFGTKKKMYGKGEVYLHELDEVYKMFNVKERTFEEWPSEQWNYQDRFALKNIKSMKVPALKTEEAPEVSGDEATESIEISNEALEDLLLSIKGLGKKKLSKILSRFEHTELVNIIEIEPRVLEDIKSIDSKLVERIVEAWSSYKEDQRELIVAQ
jgi:DNA uptake protein ComE-like DNA-binding protein